MARNRYPLAVTGSGTSTVSGGNIRLTRNNWTSGDAIPSGHTIEFMVDQGAGITNQYIYFDNSFQHGNTTAARNGTLPAGLSESFDTDSGGTVDIGYVLVSGTPSDAPGTYEWSYIVTDPYDNSTATVKFKMTIAPAGTSPTFDTTLNTNRILRNETAKQYLTDAVTTSYAYPVYTLTNISGFATGVNLQIEADGRVYVENTPDTGSIAAANHQFQLNVDLGEYGTANSGVISGNISYGDPLGSRYWGPANAHIDYEYGDFRTSNTASQVTGDYWHNTANNSGAIQFVTNQGRSSTPYTASFQGGNMYTSSANPSSSTNSGNLTEGSAQQYMATNWQNAFVSSQQGAGQVYKWTVPNGVTSFSVVAIGAGGPGTYQWSGDGGGGGGLAYVNDVTCTPGETFSVQIGTPMYRCSSSSQFYSGDSFLMRDSNNEYILIGWGGGHYSSRSQPPQGWIGASRPHSNNVPSGNATNLSHNSNAASNTQSDRGSASASTAYGTYGTYYGGYANSYGFGGGAAGYRGNANSGSANIGSSDSGCGCNGRNYSSTWGGSGGGGVGADGSGRGVSDFGHSYGTADTQSNTTSYSNIGSHGYYYGGGGGSGGSRGDWGENPYTGRGHFENTNYAASGGTHGGGGGGSGSNGSPGGGRGGPGCIRIIWGLVGGQTRKFPNTYASENLGHTGYS